ncbi:MAG: hypothetical protein R6V75_01090 [Bacteroidales bacterium]
MKAILICSTLVILGTIQLPAQKITAPGVKWKDSYTFDRHNEMKVDFYGRDQKLIRTLVYRTWYRQEGKEVVTTESGLHIPKHDYLVELDAPAKGNDTQTIFDMTNEVAIQIFGSDLDEPMYNAGRFKFPEGSEIKRLQLVATEETRTIAGYLCSKYTYTYKAITGSVWITKEVTLPNDFGIFRAAKMSALHNTLSDEGFILEMTSEDARGGKTVMTTVALVQPGSKTITLPRDKVGTAINKVSYFTF